MNISVVIPSWNGRALLPAVLAALERQSHRPAEVLVVDDGSRDDSVRWLHKHHPGVRPIVLDRNRGFAAAANVGIGAAENELVALLNNDAEPESDWLQSLAQAARTDSGRTASWACVLLRAGAANQTGGGKPRPYEAEKPVAASLESGGLRLLASGFGAPHLVGTAAGAVADQEVFGASGGAMLLKRPEFLTAGEFDVRFFGGFEDVDLACRLRLRGGQCRLVGGARVRHAGGGSFGRRRGLRQRCEFRNAACIALKNFPPHLLRRCWGAVAGAHCRALGYLVSHGHPLAALRGEIDLWRWLPQLRRDRSMVQRVVTDPFALDRWID
jgi:GT2 family glycosyltransferase